MAWGIFMAAFTVIGMLLLIFVQPASTRHQTFGVVINPPDAPEQVSADSGDRESVRRAA